MKEKNNGKWKIFEVSGNKDVYMGEFVEDINTPRYRTKECKHKWMKNINNDKQEYYFKTRLSKKELYLGDLVAPFIFEKVGFKPEDYVVYHLVEAKNENQETLPGVMSKRYIKKDEQQISYYNIALFSYCIDHHINYDEVKNDKLLGLEDSSRIKEFESTFKSNPGEYLVAVDDMLEDIKRYCGRYKLDVDMKDIEFKLKRQAFADFFLCQNDRHRGNTEFKIKDNKLTMCPIFDHEHCLAIDILGKSYNMNKFPIYTGISQVGSQKNDYQEESELLRQSGIMNADKLADSLIENSNFIMNSRFLKNNGLMACDIIAESLRDPNLCDVAVNFMNLDIRKTLNEFEQYSKIQPTTKEIMCDQYELMQEKFVQNLIAIRNNLNGKIKNEKFDAMFKKFEPSVKIIQPRIERKQNIDYQSKVNSSKATGILTKEDEELLNLLKQK